MTDQPPVPPSPEPVPDVCPDCGTPTTGLTPDPDGAHRIPCGHGVVWDPLVFSGTVPTPDTPPPPVAG